MLPWLFYDWQHARHSGFMVSMLSQMGMMIIFALSFNMLMGQAGLLSFCHSVLFGLAGYSTVHFLNAAGAGELPVPMELMPLLSGLSGLGFALVFGYMATKQRSTAFAMITLGIVQLVTTAATMFHHFFGGEGGVHTDREIGISLFGLDYGQAIQVYYLIVAWMMISAIGMYFHTMTPLGRMANACRDNHERAQFVGYDPRIVRFLQFALSGFYCRHRRRAVRDHLRDRHVRRGRRAARGECAADGLYRRRDDLLRSGAWRHPDHAAAERRQPDVELLADLCRRAVHRHGDLRADRPHRHHPGARADRALPDCCVGWRCPICASWCRGWSCCSASSAWWNCCRSSRSAWRRASISRCSARTIDTASPVPWLVSLLCLLAGGVWLALEVAALQDASGTA